MNKVRLNPEALAVQSFEVSHHMVRFTTADCTIRCGQSDDTCDPTQPPVGTCTC